MGALSPSMAIAGAGLLPNPPSDIGTALTANTQAVASAAAYANLSIVSQIADVLDDAYIAAFDANLANNISESTYNSISDITATTLPSLADQPSAGNTAADLIFNTGNVSAIGNVVLVSDVIAVNQSAILDANDLSRFCQVFMQSVGYISQANATLNSCRNADTLAQTFDPASGGMDVISTGGLNLVSTDLAALGQDFAAIGDLIDLGQLPNLGLPSALLARIVTVAGGVLPDISDMLIDSGIEQSRVTALDLGRNEFDANDERRAYRAMMAITGSALDTVKVILAVNLNSIRMMSQLLDPRQILPGSYTTLLCPTATGPLPIYIGTAANSKLLPVVQDSTTTAFTGEGATNSYDVMSLIIPPDQALANKALARSLSQIKQVSNSTLAKLSVALASVQTNTGLGAIGNLTTPLPAAVTETYQSSLGNGTGANGQITLCDVIGVTTGFRITGAFANLTSLIGNLEDSGALDNITDSYANMSITLANLFAGGTPPDGSATFDDSFTTNLIPSATTAVSSLVSQYPTDVENMSSNLDIIITSLVDQRTNQIAAEIDFGNLQANSRQATMSWTTNLHDYGTDDTACGSGTFIEQVANTNSLSGQAVIASLREGRNIQQMQEAGMSLDTQLSDK
jgi:hypothetical protein